MSRPQFVRGEPCGCHPELRQWRQGWPVSQLNIYRTLASLLEAYLVGTGPNTYDHHMARYSRDIQHKHAASYRSPVQSSHAVKQEAHMFATADKARFVLQYIQKCRSCIFPFCSQGNCVTQESYTHMFHRCACCTKDSDIRCVCSLTASYPSDIDLQPS